MSKNKELSFNEKCVLYGLVRFPVMPFVQVAKTIGIAQPTFSNIQRRLKRDRYYSVVGLPDLRALGLNLVSVMYGTFNPISTDLERRALEQGLRNAHPEIFFMVGGVHNLLIFLTSNDFVEMSKAIESVETAYVKKGIMNKDAFAKVTFSLETTLLARWFDYSNPLYIKFNLNERNIPPPEGIRKSIEKRAPMPEMNQNELKVLLRLLEDPEASEISTAKALAISRTTVAKARTKLITGGLITRCVIPNIQLLGFEVFTFSDTEFKVETTYSQRFSSTQWLLERLPIVLSIITNQQALTLYAFETFHLLQDMKRLALREYVGKGYLKGEIKSIIYAASEIESPPGPNFVPIFKKVIGPDL